MAFLLESAGRSLLLTGDMANHFVASLQKLDWEVSFDKDKGAAASSRKRFSACWLPKEFRLSAITCIHPSAGMASVPGLPIVAPHVIKKRTHGGAREAAAWVV